MARPAGPTSTPSATATGGPFAGSTVATSPEVLTVPSLEGTKL